MNFSEDLKQAIRTLKKKPGFAMVAIIVLAVGIGANTAIFSIVYGVLLRPLPFPQSDQLVQLWHVPPQKSFPGTTTFSLSAANYLDWESQNTVFQNSAIYATKDLRLSGTGEPRILHGARVESTYFDVYQVPTALGRPISAIDIEPGHENVIVLSHKLWVSEFSSDPHIVGRKVELDGRSYSVIGVMPSNFTRPSWASFWTPLVWDPVEKAVRGEHHFLAVARLKPTVSISKAQSELDMIAARLAQQFPADDAGWGAKIVPMHDYLTGDVRKPLYILLGAVAFVLLIACANVANLMFIKTLDRRKELAIRTALGATRGRIIAQVLTECVLLSFTGGILGLVVAHAGKSLVVDYLATSMPRLEDIHIDGTVLAFTFVISILTGVLAGVAPAWRLSKSDPNEALKQGGRTGTAASSPGRNLLVTAEVALSLVLLVGAGLMIRTLSNLHAVDPGFEPQHVISMSVNPGDVSSFDQAKQVVDQLDQRVRSIPGVQAAALTDDLPLMGGSTQPIQIEGYPVVAMADQPEVAVRIITSQYFKTMQIPLRSGRMFADSDTSKSAKVVVVSQSLADRFWPNQNPIGRRLALTFAKDGMREVVGVVGDVKDNGLDAKDAVPMLYYPIAQLVVPADAGPFRGFGLEVVARATGNPADSAPTIVAAIHSVSPNTPVTEIRTMQDVIEETISPQRFNMLLLATFAGIALFLSAIGIYSVLAYSVRQRVREIGIRIALGAQLRDVLRMVLSEGMRPTILGVVIGLVASIVLSRLISSLIYGIKVLDIPTFAIVTIILTLVGLAASFSPALRATNVDPLSVLRDE
jgi:putative ABC transport system permease protein